MGITSDKGATVHHSSYRISVLWIYTVAFCSHMPCIYSLYFITGTFLNHVLRTVSIKRFTSVFTLLFDQELHFFFFTQNAQAFLENSSVVLKGLLKVPGTSFSFQVWFPSPLKKPKSNCLHASLLLLNLLNVLLENSTQKNFFFFLFVTALLRLLYWEHTVYINTV